MSRWLSKMAELLSISISLFMSQNYDWINWWRNQFQVDKKRKSVNMIFYLLLASLSVLKPFCQASRNYLEQSRLQQEVNESLFERMIEFVMSKHFLKSHSMIYGRACRMGMARFRSATTSVRRKRTDRRTLPSGLQKFLVSAVRIRPWGRQRGFVHRTLEAVRIR